MVEHIEEFCFSQPTHMMEVMTIDQRSNMINQLDDVSDLTLTNSIGKFFILNSLEVSEGTVFIIDKLGLIFKELILMIF